MRRLLRRLADLSIRHKLLLSYLLLVLFFLCLSLAASSVLVVRQSRAQVVRSASLVFSQTRAYLQYKTDSVRTLLYSLTSSTAIQELFERRAEYYHESIGRWPIDAQQFEKLSHVTAFNPDIVGTAYYMAYGLASVFENDTFIPLARARDEAWYAKLMQNERRIWWYADDRSASPSGPRLLHAARGVPDSQNIMQTTGVIRFDVAEDMVLAPLANAVLTESTSAWLADADATVIASAGPMGVEGAAAVAAKVRSLHGDLGSETWSMISAAGSRYLVGAQAVDGTDWVLFLALPNRDVRRLSARPALSLLLVLLAILPLTVFLSFFVSGSATRRIHGLIARMDRVAEGDFSGTLDPGNSDEIGRLTDRFNAMTAEIGQLVEEKYRLGTEVKNLELKALQAQINPHFLYNTLDLIKWMSVRHGASDIGALVTALSRFYKLSLGKGEDLADLGAELEHVRTYVQIQNMRFEDAIALEIDAPAALLSYRVPKLIIQPLVENAIFHGIMMTADERGAIRIRCEESGGRLLVTVDDDGVGLDDEVARTVLTGGDGTSEHHGYGVRNIHERLQLAYGAGYGLSFGKAPGGGTRVTITLPGPHEEAPRA